MRFQKLCIISIIYIIIIVIVIVISEEMDEVNEESDDVSRHCENTVSEFQCETNSGYTLEVDVNKLNERKYFKLLPSFC